MIEDRRQSGPHSPRVESLETDDLIGLLAIERIGDFEALFQQVAA